MAFIYIQVLPLHWFKFGAWWRRAYFVLYIYILEILYIGQISKRRRAPVFGFIMQITTTHSTWSDTRNSQNSFYRNFVWRSSRNFPKIPQSQEMPVCLQIVVQMYPLEPIQRELSLFFFSQKWHIRTLTDLKKTPTCEMFWSFKRPYSCPVCTTRCILWI